MAYHQTLESKTAQTVLQQPSEVVIGGHTYTVAPPTTATLIRVSELVSQLPSLKLDGDQLVAECLGVAQDCRVLGDIAAVLVLGAPRHQSSLCGIWGLRMAREKRRREALAREILETATPAELNRMVAKALSGMDLGDFFALTTFLLEVNILRRTRKVEENGTTASGR